VRALIITPDYPPKSGGIQILSRRLAEGLESFDVRVVTLGSSRGRFRSKGGPAVTRVGGSSLPQAAKIALLNAAALGSAVRYRPDVVLCMHIVAAPSAASLRRLLGVPFVLYFHAREVVARPRLAHWAARSAARVVVVSRHTRRLAEDLGVEPRKLRLITPGVDLADRRQPRSRKPLVVTVSRLVSRYKGHDVLARAMTEARQQIPDAEWVVIGDGPLRPYVEQLVAGPELQGAARLLGSVPDVERDAWLDRAHVFALPSRVPPDGVGGEGFGIVYLEAAAHELPVVAANEGGALDAVIDGETGVLVDPTDERAVANALVGLLSDAQRRDRLGKQAARRAQEFAWPRIAQEVEGVLVEAVGR